MDHQVSVSLIKPGGVKTEIWDKIGDENGEASKGDQVADDHAKLLGRAVGSDALKVLYSDTVLTLGSFPSLTLPSLSTWYLARCWPCM